MKATLLTIVQLLAVWSLVSILAGMALSRLLQCLARGEQEPAAPRANGFRPAARDPEPPLNVGWMDPVDFGEGGSEDAVEATGEVYDPVPVTDWPDVKHDALARLHAAIADPWVFNEEMQVYELRSELDLLGVAGFTNRWKWRER